MSEHTSRPPSADQGVQWSKGSHHVHPGFDSQQGFGPRSYVPVCRAGEKERALISERTRAALQAAKARGQKLGSPIAAQTAAKARANWSAYAKAGSETARTVAREIRVNGVTTLKGIAAALQARGVRTPRGNTVWNPSPGPGTSIRYRVHESSMFSRSCPVLLDYRRWFGALCRRTTKEPWRHRLQTCFCPPCCSHLQSFSSPPRWPLKPSAGISVRSKASA